MLAPLVVFMVPTMIFYNQIVVRQDCCRGGGIHIYRCSGSNNCRSFAPKWVDGI